MTAYGPGWGVSAFDMMTVTDSTPMAGDWLTLEEAAKEIGRSTSTLRRQAISGALNAYKSGRNWQVHRRDLEAYRRRTQVERSVARAVFQDTALPEEQPAILTDREWYVLVEHVRHGRSLGDIAAELGVTRTAVWQALDAAVRKYIDNPWD